MWDAEQYMTLTHKNSTLSNQIPNLDTGALLITDTSSGGSSSTQHGTSAQRVTAVCPTAVMPAVRDRPWLWGEGEVI
jgi:hypothetical protein